MIILVVLFSGNYQKLSGQVSPREAEVVSTLSKFFDAIQNADTTALISGFHPQARLFTTFIPENGQANFLEMEIDQFVEAVSRKGAEQWEEKIWTYDIRIDGPLASVWTDYTFFRNGKPTHCGVNAFQLIQQNDGWKILQVVDTRHKAPCQQEPYAEKMAINQFLDDWHQAAARADEEAFFGAMTFDAIYLGTDDAEYWRWGEFLQWAKPYFEQGKTWDFEPVERHVYLSNNGQFGWFDEKLDTWMGRCRGSGVVERTPEGWKIKHYNLAVTVPNSLMKDFIELVKKHATAKE